MCKKKEKGIERRFINKMFQISIRGERVIFLCNVIFTISSPNFTFETWKDYTKKEREIGMNF